MELPTKSAIEAAAKTVYAAMPATPQYAWPLLAERCGATVWVKHENHTPTGAFKVRGGLLHMARLHAGKPESKGVIAATRGNHGQSIAYGARANGLAAVIVVPEGNSVEKNAAMRALGMAPALNRLSYIGRAITPTDSPIRFHARFFLAQARHAVGTLAGSGELLDLRWVTLEQARRLPIVDVTEFMLEEVGRLLSGDKPRGRAPLFSYRGNRPVVRYP